MHEGMQFTISIILFYLEDDNEDLRVLWLSYCQESKQQDSSGGSLRLGSFTQILVCGASREQRSETFIY